MDSKEQFNALLPDPRKIARQHYSSVANRVLEAKAAAITARGLSELEATICAEIWMQEWMNIQREEQERRWKEANRNMTMGTVRWMQPEMRRMRPKIR